MGYVWRDCCGFVVGGGDTERVLCVVGGGDTGTGLCAVGGVGMLDVEGLTWCVWPGPMVAAGVPGWLMVVGPCEAAVVVVGGVLWRGAVVCC